MPKTIDFDGLLKDFFQADMPIEKNVQECPQPKKNSVDFSKALGEIFKTEGKIDVEKFITSTANSAGCADMDGDNNSLLQACTLYVFMRKIVMGKFGMGVDYAIEIDGERVKSWFTIPEAIEAAKSLGYKLTIAEARAYLDKLIKQRYIETDNYKYRRRLFWDKDMECFLRKYSA